jgi:protein-L-isoaspartate(D-aspartate) O-methyltransferase
MEVDDSIYIPQDLARNLIIDSMQSIDPQYKNLLTTLKERGMISQRVYELMARIDRKNYVPDDIMHTAYSDIPRPIGFNTTISAPHMHAMTLEKLKDHLKAGGKALDIGTGSGYIAACFAEAMGKGSQVYMIDHIKEILDFANNNIKKGNAYLIKSKRIISLLKDGRHGLHEFGPYDVIHVGGAID